MYKKQGNNKRARTQTLQLPFSNAIVNAYSKYVGINLT